VGAPYSLGLIKYPGGAIAGEIFFPQPLIAVLDRGGNTVTSYNEGDITGRAIRVGGGNSTLDYLRPKGGTMSTIQNGTSDFVGLKIDDAGLNYVLQFTSSLVRAPHVSLCAMNGAEYSVNHDRLSPGADISRE